MAIERTLSIIKPDAVGKNVIARSTAGSRRPACASSPHDAAPVEGAGRAFYAVHRERPFYATCAPS